MESGKVKRWLLISILTTFAIFSCSSPGCGSTTTVGPGSTPSIAPRVGALAPDFTLPSLDGEVVKLDEMRGQPVLVNFWGTWCTYCRRQMPYLQAAFEEKGQEVKFIAIDVGEGSGTVRRYVDDTGIGFTVALDMSRAVASAYNIRYYPTTFFVDEQGVIKYIKLGAFGSTSELMAVLEALSETRARDLSSRT